jgi:hypothetical protein
VARQCVVRSAHTDAALSTHLAELSALYGALFIVNLVDQQGYDVTA